MDKKKLIVGITAPGSVVLIQGQLKHFQKLGYKTYLLAPETERTIDFCKNEGCELLGVAIERNISVLKDIISLFRIFAILLRVKPHILNVGTPKMGLLGAVAGFFSKTPLVIYTCRGFRFEHEQSTTRSVLKGMEKITCFFADRIICISKSVMDFGVREKLFDASKAVVIGHGSSNGIDLNRFKVTDHLHKESIEMKHNLFGKDVFVYGFVGRVVDRKGINELLHAFFRLYEADNKVRLLIVGSIEFEQISQPEYWNESIKHPGIKYVGPQANVPLYLLVMDVFVLPAWWEGFGNVIIQASAMGVPVISTDATGTKDAVKNGYSGVLIEPKNVDDLLIAMRIMKEDDVMRIVLGQNGIVWASNFDELSIWSGIENIYGGRTL